MGTATSYGFAAAAAGMGHIHPSGYISAVPQMPVSSPLGYAASNPGVSPTPTSATISPSSGSFMSAPLHSMASVIQHRSNSSSSSSGSGNGPNNQESSKQRRSSSNHRYTPIAPAPPSQTPNSTASASATPSTGTGTTGSSTGGYYSQHSGSGPGVIPRPVSQYLGPSAASAASTASANQAAAIASCSLAKLQQLTNGLADVSSSPHHTMTPPPNPTPPPPPHLHGLSYGHQHHGVVATPPPAGSIPSQQSVGAYAKYYQASAASPISVSPSPAGVGLNTGPGAIHTNPELGGANHGGHNANGLSSGRSSAGSSVSSSASSRTGGNNSQRVPVTINSQLMQYQFNGYRMSMAGMGMAGMAGMAGMGMAGMGMMAAQHQALNPASYIAATNPGFINQGQIPMQMGVMNMHAHAAAAHAVQHGHPHAPPHGHAAAAAAAQAAQYQDQRTPTPGAMYTTYGYGIVPQLNGTMRR